MIKLNSISIQNKIMGFFVLLTVILFLTTGWLFFQSAKETIKAERIQEMATLSQETENKIERFLFERYGDMQVISQSPLLKNSDIDESLKLEYLESMKSTYKAYDYIMTTDKDGIVKLAAGELNGDHAYDKWIGMVLEGNNIVSDIIYKAESDSYKIYFAAPIKDRSGKITGCAVSCTNFNAISEIVTGVRIGKTGYVYLIQDSGRTIFHPYEKFLGEAYIASGGKQIKHIKRGDLDYIASYHPLKKYDTQSDSWYLVVEQSEKEAFEVVDTLRNYIIIVIVISIIILIVLAANLSILITKPIRDLVKEAKNIAEGRIGAKIQVRTSDEVGRLAESFNILIENIKRANQLASLGMLSAGVAHEIRNPLTSIKGFAQYIKSELGSDHELNEDVSIIINEVDRLNNIVDRFLNFARPESPMLQLADVNNSIKNVINLVKEGQLPKNITLKVMLDKLPSIYIDSNQIEQAILNLVLNSIQAMPDGGTIRIISNFDFEMDTVKIQICDDGAGIPSDIADKVFQPFFTTKNKGTGLGLAICARIIEGHKGMIELHSISNVETCFTIILPLNSQEKGDE